MYASDEDTGMLYVGGGHPFAWRPVTNNAPPDILVAVSEHPEVLYGLGGGLYRSVDGGRDWAAISCDFGAIGDGAAAAVSKSDPSSLYQVFQPGDSYYDRGPDESGPGDVGGYYRSTDAGKTWSRSRIRATDEHPKGWEMGPSVYAELGASVYAQGWDWGMVYVGGASLVVEPTNPNDVTVVRTNGGVFRTRGGGDWEFTRLPGPGRFGPQVTGLAYGAGPNPVLWAGTYSGAFRRKPDGEWVRSGLRGQEVSVFPDARVASVAFAIVGDHVRPGCVRRTTNNGKTWLPVRGLACNIWGMTVGPRDDAIYAWTWARHLLYHSYDGFRQSRVHRLYRSTDHGATWVRLPPPP